MSARPASEDPSATPVAPTRTAPPQAPAGQPTRRVPLGTLIGARSGDKGGDANIGVWVERDDAWDWLHTTLTVETLQTLLPETAGLPAPGTRSPTSARSTSPSPESSAPASPPPTASTPRPRPSASGCAPGTSDVPAHLLPTHLPLTPEGTAP